LVWNKGIAIKPAAKPSTTASVILEPTPTPSESTNQPTDSQNLPSSSPTAAVVFNVTPGAFCTPAGAIGQSTKGLAYTCKPSATDTRNRWRQ
jgi:hypothetical protein